MSGSACPPHPPLSFLHRPRCLSSPGPTSILPLTWTWMSSSTRDTGIAPITDIGIDRKLTTASGFTFPPTGCLEPLSTCPPIFVMCPPDTGTSRTEMSERTGRHGRGISTGKGTEEGNGTERTGGIVTGMATIEEVGADTAIKPIERKHSGAPGSSLTSVFPRSFFFRIYSPCSLRQRHSTWKECSSRSPGTLWIGCRFPGGICQNPSRRTYRHGRSGRC